MPTNPKNFIRIAQGAHPCRVFVAKFPNIYSFGVPQPTAAPARFAHKAKWPFVIISYCQYSVVSKNVSTSSYCNFNIHTNWFW